MFFIEHCFGFPIMGLYTVEITNNTTLGMINVYQSLIMFGFSLIVPFLVDEVPIPLLFYIFGGITFGHCLFTLLCIKETAKLNDR